MDDFSKIARDQQERFEAAIALTDRVLTRTTGLVEKRFGVGFAGNHPDFVLELIRLTRQFEELLLPEDEPAEFERGPLRR